MKLIIDVDGIMLKKLIFRLIILSILVIVIFFFGWINWRIKPGHYALYVSKTSGIRNAIIKPGEFVWKLEALLPTNVMLFQFKPVMHSDTLELSGVLPSANAYKTFINGNPDFSWKINVTISFTYNYEYIPTLYNSQGVCTSEQLLELLQQKSNVVKQKIQEYLFLLDFNNIKNFFNGTISESLLKSLAEDFPELVISNISINCIQFPDFSTYTIAQNLYREFLEKFQKALEPAMLESASQIVKTQNELEQLKKYGELFKQYPELIQYLAIKAGISIQKP